MGTSTTTQHSDRWWIIALAVAIAGIGLVALLSRFPTSIWVWALAGGILLFVIVLLFNPRYRYWRRAIMCFGTAGLCAFVPTFFARANLEGIGSFAFVSESSPLVVLGFLAAGLYLSWLDSRLHTAPFATARNSSTNTNLLSYNSPLTATRLNAGGDIIINHGISDGTILAALSAQQLATRVQPSASMEAREVDEDLVWRLIDDIKDARRRFECEDVIALLANLQNIFERSGSHWPKMLRTETLLLMAEEERAKITRLKIFGDQFDLTRLQELLKESRSA